MSDDVRCCGTGTCLIHEDGYCWCGLQWDGETMCFSDAPNLVLHEPQARALEPMVKQST